MAKLPNQKLKLLHLARILLEETDEAHPMGISQLICALEQVGIHAERKSLYDDLESLRVFGLDIVQIRSKTTGYYIGSRTFELPELKLLVDSVQSSKFITEKKTMALIRKIESLASRQEAATLQRQVYVTGRVKSMNESVYYNVDTISLAISQNRRIRFRYFEYTPEKQRKFRHDGDFYEISPFALMWDQENYYMLGYDAPAGMLKHYRVDKMVAISITQQPRAGQDAFSAVDMSTYSKQVFGMFSGQQQQVRLRFTNHLAGAVIDRFSSDVILTPDDAAHFVVHANVAVSPQFFAWLFGFGAEVEILSPDSVRAAFRQQAEAIAAQYR